MLDYELYLHGDSPKVMGHQLQSLPPSSMRPMAARRRLIDDPLDLMACSPDSRHELVFSPRTPKDLASFDRDWAFLHPDCQV